MGRAPSHALERFVPAHYQAFAAPIALPPMFATFEILNPTKAYTGA